MRLVLAPMLALLFVVLVIAVPVGELWLILTVGEAIGAGPTILLLLASALLGAWLMRNQGAAAWRRFRESAAAGQVPTEPAVDGFLVVLGGTLLLVPGFVSDVVGLCLLLPPTRTLLRGRLIRGVGRRARVGFMGATRADGSDVRDFAHSDQPRRTTSTTQGERQPDFDFETHQLHE